METPRDKVSRLARRQVVASQYRIYATLAAEHERLRRARWLGRLRATCQPDPAAWHTLHFLATVHDPAGRATKTLIGFFEDVGRNSLEGSSSPRPSSGTSTLPCESSREGGAPSPPTAPPRSVPSGAWREALRAGIDLAADVLVRHGAALPWGQGRPRVPRNRAEFESIAGFLRDLPPDDDRPPLAEALERADLPDLPRRERAGHRATFYRGRQVLSLDGVRMALPMGRELAFLELLVERRGRAEVTPGQEHGANWTRVADELRKRIRRATGANLLGAVVLSARGPTGGYRLAPGVRVRDD